MRVFDVVVGKRVFHHQSAVRVGLVGLFAVVFADDAQRFAQTVRFREIDQRNVVLNRLGQVRAADGVRRGRDRFGVVFRQSQRRARLVFLDARQFRQSGHQPRRVDGFGDRAARDVRFDHVAAERQRRARAAGAQPGFVRQGGHRLFGGGDGVQTDLVRIGRRAVDERVGRSLDRHGFAVLRFVRERQRLRRDQVVQIQRFGIRRAARERVGRAVDFDGLVFVIGDVGRRERQPAEVHVDFLRRRFQIVFRRHHGRAVDLNVVGQVFDSGRFFVVRLHGVVQFVHHGDGGGGRAVFFRQVGDVDGDVAVRQNRAGRDARVVREFIRFGRSAPDVADRDGLTDIGGDVRVLERDRSRIARRHQNVRARRRRIDFQRRTRSDVARVVGFVVVDRLFQQADQLDGIDRSRAAVDQLGNVDGDDAVRGRGVLVGKNVGVLTDRDGFVQIVVDFVADEVDAGGVFDVPVDFGQFEFARRDARHGVGVGRGLQAGRRRHLEFNRRAAVGLLDFDRRAVGGDGKARRARQGVLNDAVEFFDGVPDGHDARAEVDRDDGFVRFGRIAGRAVRRKFENVGFAVRFHRNRGMVRRNGGEFQLRAGGIDVLRRVVRRFGGTVRHQRRRARRHADVQRPHAVVGFGERQFRVVRIAQRVVNQDGRAVATAGFGIGGIEHGGVCGQVRAERYVLRFLRRAADRVQVDRTHVRRIDDVVVDVHGRAGRVGVGFHVHVVADFDQRRVFFAVKGFQRPRLQIVSVVVFQIAVVVDAEIADAGVAPQIVFGRLGRLRRDEKSLARNAQVGGLRRAGQQPLNVDARAGAALHAAAGVARGRRLFRHQRRKAGGVAFVSDGVDVGDVVRDDAHGGGLRVQSRNARFQCSE